MSLGKSARSGKNGRNFRRCAAMPATLHHVALAVTTLLAGPVPALAQGRDALPPVPPAATYADLADLADSASLVLRARVSGLKRVDPARVRGVRPGWGRYLVSAKTLALMSGSAAVGEKLAYLADFQLDSRGKPPKFGKNPVLVFANPVAGRPGELQLVAPDAQVAWSQSSEASLREILYELIAPEKPARITGVREAIHVPGNLRGEGQTQVFLATDDGSAASITVSHKPGVPTQWGASFSEVIASPGPPPAQGTLTWYRLACFLPNSLPAGANLSDSAATRAAAEADYRMVLGELGVCPRSRS
jgi:hypothetical protein